MTDNNNIGDFFRNKINSNENNLSSEWDQPDKSVRDATLNELMTPPIVPFMAWSTVVKSLIFFTILSLLALSIFLVNENGKLKTFHATQLSKLDQEHKNQIENSQKIEFENKALKSQINNLESSLNNLSTKNNDLGVEFKQLLQSKMKSDEKIIVLNKKTDILSDKLQKLLVNNYSKSALSIYEAPRLVLTKVSYLPINFSSFSNDERSFDFSPSFTKTTEEKPRFKPYFEIGYRLSLSKYDFSIGRAFDKQAIVGEKRFSDSNSAYANGLFFAYGLSNNWKVYSGASISKLRVAQASSLVFKYDSSKEFENDKGDRINNLNYRTNSLFGETQTDISIQVPVDLRPEEYLEFVFRDKYELSFYQVPIGVQYFVNTNRFGFFADLALEWNTVRFDSYFSESELFYRDRAIKLEKDVIPIKNLKANNYFSTSFGVGLQYEILENWFGQFSVLYNYRFINQNGNALSSPSKIGTSWDLGLNYRF